MFLYLIELFLAGVLLFKLLDDQLPSPIQVVSGVLLGYLLHVLNCIVLIGVGIGLTTASVVILVSLECIALLVGLAVKHKQEKWLKRVFSLDFWIIGVIYVVLLYIFYKLNLSFITNDSLYLILFGQDLVQSGFSEWYFAAPTSMGIYIPLIHAIGPLFGLDYVWFIQPVLSLVLIIALFYFAYRSLIRYINNKGLAIGLALLGLLLFGTTNLLYGTMIYIHTNLSSALFLFLTILPLYFAIEEQKSGWLVLSGLALISFGLMRIENVLMALLVIFFYVASGKLTRRQSLLTFTPYLLIQGLWYGAVSFMQVESFLSSMGKVQIILISVACFMMIGVILLSQWRVLKLLLTWGGKLLPYILLAAWLVLGIMDPSQAMINLKALATNLFVTGNWGSFWVIVLALMGICALARQFPQKDILYSFLISFISVVEILGFFRHPYHDQWFDSANRMMIHIAPLVIFVLVTQIAAATSQSVNQPSEQKG